ncbi:MAG: hypothetical protein F6J92_17930, partial [Symploca sp. SIO1A3]|nr:hypothetical protein [Symploca sp. SIO1A3]
MKRPLIVLFIALVTTVTLVISALLATGKSNPESELTSVDSTPFTLQLLHASDFESGLEALEDVPRFSA